MLHITVQLVIYYLGNRVMWSLKIFQNSTSLLKQVIMHGSLPTLKCNTCNTSLYHVQQNENILKWTFSFSTSQMT